jgi:O-antigen ligase
MALDTQYDTSNSTGWNTTVGMFFALTGVLIATSIFNVGDSGISFFYLVFLVAFLGLIFPSGWLPWVLMDRESLKIIALVSVIGIALFATTLMQILINEEDGIRELVHLVSRLSFLAYFVVALRFINGEALEKTLIWIRRFLIVICAYGAYQVPAKLLGLPLFLDWLRNNHSFLMYDYNDAGWISIARANSIYAEPSETVIPILVLFMLNIYLKAGKVSKLVAWTSLTLFAVATFSRTVWIGLAVAVIAWVCSRSTRLEAALRKRRFPLLVLTLILLLALPLWGLVGADSGGDLSAQERSGDIVVGLNAIKDAPLFGHGWNSFSDVASRYTDVALFIDPEVNFTFIHNMVVSYMQQAGLSGLSLAALPFVLLICWSKAPPWMTFSTLASFLFTAEFGDIGYSSLTWLWIALLINMNALSAPQPISAEDFGFSARPGRPQMSVSPSSPS